MTGVSSSGGDRESSRTDTDPMFAPTKYHLSGVFVTEYERASDTLIERNRLWLGVAELLKKKTQWRPSQKEILIREAERLAAH